jgi:hypothetical protein
LPSAEVIREVRKLVFVVVNKRVPQFACENLYLYLHTSSSGAGMHGNIKQQQQQQQRKVVQSDKVYAILMSPSL